MLASFSVGVQVGKPAVSTWLNFSLRLKREANSYFYSATPKIFTASYLSCDIELLLLHD